MNVHVHKHKRSEGEQERERNLHDAEAKRTTRNASLPEDPAMFQVKLCIKDMIAEEIGEPNGLFIICLYDGGIRASVKCNCEAAKSTS